MRRLLLKGIGKMWRAPRRWGGTASPTARLCYEKCGRQASKFLVSQVYDPGAPRVKADMLSVFILTQIECSNNRRKKALDGIGVPSCANYHRTQTTQRMAWWTRPRRLITDGVGLQHSCYHRCVYVPICCLCGCFAHQYNSSAPETSTQKLCCKPVQEDSCPPPETIASTHVRPKARTHRLNIPQNPASSLLVALRL